MRVPLSPDDDLEALPWRPTRRAGISWIPLHLGEPAAPPPDAGPAAARRGPVPATVLIRMEPGHGYAAHRHVGTEDVLVLRGGYRDAWGVHRRGDHVHYPAGSVHAPVALGEADRPADASNPACVLYSSVPAGIEPVDPEAVDPGPSES